MTESAAKASTAGSQKGVNDSLLPPTVATPSVAVRAYLSAFRLVCIAVTPNGVRVGRDIGRIEQPTRVYWTRSATDALKVLQHCRYAGTDLEAAAVALKVPLTPHAVTVQRAETAVARINAALQEAQRSGAMRDFNRAYSVERKRRKAAGEPVLTYWTAMSRLRSLLFREVAGTRVDKGLIEAALGMVGNAHHLEGERACR
jgi:hypothetical protein